MGVQKCNKISAKVAACFSFIVDPTLPKLIFLCGNDPNFAQKKELFRRQNLSRLWKISLRRLVGQDEEGK